MNQSQPRGAAPFSVVVALLLVSLMAMGWAFKQRPSGDLRKLDPAVRSELYERAYVNTEILCRGEQRAQTQTACRAQADWLRQFPECDADCYAFSIRSPVRPR
jgi:hypothetical protein